MPENKMEFPDHPIIPEKDAEFDGEQKQYTLGDQSSEFIPVESEELIEYEGPSQLETQLTAAKTALVEATSNFERVKIRDTAKAIKAAAEILKHKKIRDQAAELIVDAEYHITVANPAKTPQESGQLGGRGNKAIPSGSEVSEEKEALPPRQLSKLRKAYTDLTPEEFEEAKQDIRKNDEPITRSGIAKSTEIKRREKNREERNQQLIEQSTDLPIGKERYSIIYADPPWKYDFSKVSADLPDEHYPTMTVTEIMALDIPSICTDDAVLYLWATNPKLVEALDVIKAWGFTYKSNAVWVKDHFGTGYWWRGQHELLLVATRGNFPPPIPQLRISSVFHIPKGQHSEKPNPIREAITKMFPPELPKIELFARTEYEGWKAWGNEI